MAKIVHWGKYYPPDRGGIESVTATVAGGAAEAGHSVTVVCFTPSKADGPAMVQGIRVLRASQAALVASQPLSWKYLWLALREGRRADLVHIHAPNMLAALAALLVGARPKVLVHWHSDVINKGLLGMLLGPLERAMLRRADRVICSAQMYADGSDPLRPFIAKVDAVPIGISDVAAHQHAPSAVPNQIAAHVAGRRLILAVGRLVPYKGFSVLIDAAAHLPHDVAVVIVGSGPMQERLQDQIARFGLQTRVLLTGGLPVAVLDALYRQAVLFCLPSVERSEAFGVVLLEAMAYGVPIVATSIKGSGVPWVNQHQVTGLNVAVGDPQQLAAACLTILDTPDLRERLSKGARQRYLEQFTESRSNARMLQEYASLLMAGTPR